MPRRPDPSRASTARALALTLALPASACTAATAPEAPDVVAVGLLQLPEDCTPSTQAPLLSRGALSLAWRFAYEANALLRTTGAEPAFVEGAIVRIEEPGGFVVDLGGPNPFSIPAGGTVDPLRRGEGVARADLIPSSYGQALAGLIPEGGSYSLVLEATFTGRLADGRAFETQPLRFPVDVYNRSVLVECAEGADPRADRYCLLGQDVRSALDVRCPECGGDGPASCAPPL